MINHPFGTGFYQLSMVMTGGWFMIVVPTLETQILKWNFSYATHTHTHTQSQQKTHLFVSPRVAWDDSMPAMARGSLHHERYQCTNGD